VTKLSDELSSVTFSTQHQSTFNRMHRHTQGNGMANTCAPRRKRQFLTKDFTFSCKIFSTV